MPTYNRIKCNKGYLHKQPKQSQQLTLPMLEGCEWLITDVVNRNGSGGGDSFIIEYHSKTTVQGYQGMYDGVVIQLTPEQLTNFESIEDITI